jgi:hypothetical protein
LLVASKLVADLRQLEPQRLIVGFDGGPSEANLMERSLAVWIAEPQRVRSL